MKNVLCELTYDTTYFFQNSVIFSHLEVVDQSRETLLQVAEKFKMKSSLTVTSSGTHFFCSIQSSFYWLFNYDAKIKTKYKFKMSHDQKALMPSTNVFVQ